jgi:pimeloyl-ACP methyl ester carboxylesterase
VSLSVTPDTLSVDVPGGRLAAERWPGPGPTIVLLHSGVNDRRAWTETAQRLVDAYAVVAYDRRGFGESPLSTDPFTHVEDLRAVLDAVEVERAWLVGSSAGGRVALDAALTFPERVAGLVLLAPAVSGAPGGLEADPETDRLDALIEAAVEAGDLDEANRLEAWLWLDGPAGPEGRVGGPVRELFLAMNAIALRSEAESAASTGTSDVDAWSRLAEVRVPVTVAWGDLDIDVLNQRCQEIVERLPSATGRELSHVAHLPYLEDPDLIADLIRRAVAAGG